MHEHVGDSALPRIAKATHEVHPSQHATRDSREDPAKRGTEGLSQASGLRLQPTLPVTLVAHHAFAVLTAFAVLATGVTTCIVDCDR